MKRILVTGPDGFVGSVLCAALLKQGFAVRGAQWQAAPLPHGCESVVVGNIGAYTNWSAALTDVDTVVHLAARVHVMHESAADPLEAFRSVNVAGTRRLAEAAEQAGVRRFILMSTIKVNGERTGGRRETADCRPQTGDCLCSEGLTQRRRDAKAYNAEGNAAENKNLGGLGGFSEAGVRLCSRFTEGDAAAPEDAYGISKWEAEQALREVAGGMDTVVLRAPLIYGPGVKGNMLSLMKLASTGLPLPLGAVRNQRSLLYVGNLADFIIRCIEHPAAANETFLISDNHDLSTTDLLRMIRQAMGKSPRLIPVPAAWFRLAGRLTGKSAVVDRLFGSLQVDSTKARQLTGWTPPFTVEEGIREMVEGIGK